MNTSQRLINAAALELSLRLVAPPRKEARSLASEYSPVRKLHESGLEFDQEVLRKLARAVVSAVLDLSGSDINPARMSQIIQDAAQAQLKSDMPGRERLMARLAAETPRLINLPRLARLAGEGLSLAPLQASGPDSNAVLGQNAAFANALEDLENVARTDFPVVIWGETGTGKELLARRLHNLSARNSGPFVPVNCAALTGSLLESELFGHVKGAFTGAAASKTGYIGAARGGTLFLDEIGETGREFQVRLLRVLEDQVVVPVGSPTGHPVDFRLVCASHVDLEEEASRGRFLTSLLYRINVVPIKLPPLRERPEDVPILASHFLAQACRVTGVARRLHPEVLKCLQAYDWPGNVRELRHLIQRLVALSRDEEIGPGALPANCRQARTINRQNAFTNRLDAEPDIPQARKHDLASFLAGQCGEKVSNADLRTALDCSDSTAKNFLRSLADMGLIEPVGQRGGRRYLVCEPVETKSK